MRKAEILAEIRKIFVNLGEHGWDTLTQAIYEHEEEAIVKATEGERGYAINCAAAALVEAKVPIATIVELLRKYYRLDEQEAAAALGEGQLLAEKKALKAKPGKTGAKASNKK